MPAKTRAQANEYQRRMVAKRRAAGECKVCQEPVARLGLWHCTACLEDLREYQKNRREQRKAAGLCARCGGPEPSPIHCAACAASLLATNTKHRQKAKEARQQAREVACAAE